MGRSVHYPIRAVARLTGLSLDTLRAWERRYGAVTPVRDPRARGRVYTAAQVDRLTTLARLVDQGHAISRIAGMGDAALHRLLSHSASPEPPTVATRPDEALLDAARRYDLPTVEALLGRHAALLPPTELIFTIVLPLLRDVGARWEAGTIRPSHEHLLSAVIRHVLGGVLRTLPRHDGRDGIVMATLSGERHELGLLCAAVLAASVGRRVLYLGPDLPAADIVHATQRSESRTVMIAATTPNVVEAEEWKALGRVREYAELWVGGARAQEAREHLGDPLRLVTELNGLARLLVSHAR